MNLDSSKNHKSANIQRTDLYLVSEFLKLKSTFQKKKKIYGASMNPSELLCFKDNKFFGVIIFSQRHN